MPINEKSPDGIRDTEAQQYDWSTYDYPSIAIVEAVADATGRDQATLERLQEYVECDALDALVTDHSSEFLEFSFVYDDVYVTISGDGRLLVDTDW